MERGKYLLPATHPILSSRIHSAFSLCMSPDGTVTLEEWPRWGALHWFEWWRLFEYYASQWSGSVTINRYGSGSFHQQAKKIEKTLISSVLWLLDNLLSYINVPTVSYKQKNSGEKFLVGILKAIEKKGRIRIRNPMVRIRGSGSVSKCYNHLEHGIASSRSRQLLTPEQSLVKLPVRPILPIFHHSSYSLLPHRPRRQSGPSL